MQIDPKQQSKLDNYKLLIGSVLPRPIAFVTSLNENSTINAAPFSFFNVVGTEPPLIGFTCMRKLDGQMKDTARNIVERGEFVVHVVDSENIYLVNDTSIEFPAQVSEVEAVGLSMLPSEKVSVPRVAEAKIHMECRLYQHIPLGGTHDHPNSDFIVGEIVLFHIADSLIQGGRIDTVQLDPISRLAGTTYAKLGEMFSLPRLPYEEWLTKKG